MKKTINNTHIAGYLYEHTMERKKTGPNSANPGTPYIGGTISIATDEAMTNIVVVNYGYVTQYWDREKKKPNKSYSLLADLADGKGKTALADGKDEAMKLVINSSIGVNEFYARGDGDEEELVSNQRNDGGFINVVSAFKDDDNDENQRSTFATDILITNVTVEEADPERNSIDRAKISGVIFNYRGAIFPASFYATNPKAIVYFSEKLAPTAKEPVFTKVWGRQESTVVTKTYTDESAFGEAAVRTTEYTRKSWTITGAAKEPYMYDKGEDSDLTAEEMEAKKADRMTYLSTIKERAEKAASEKANATKGAISDDDDFDF